MTPTRSPLPAIAEFRIELRYIEGRKPWLLVAYKPNGQARIVSDHASKDAAKRGARKRGVEVTR